MPLCGLRVRIQRALSNRPTTEPIEQPNQETAEGDGVAIAW